MTNEDVRQRDSVVERSLSSFETFCNATRDGHSGSEMSKCDWQRSVPHYERINLKAEKTAFPPIFHNAMDKKQLPNQEDWCTNQTSWVLQSVLWDFHLLKCSVCFDLGRENAESACFESFQVFNHISSTNKTLHSLHGWKYLSAPVNAVLRLGWLAVVLVRKEKKTTQPISNKWMIPYVTSKLLIFSHPYSP